MENPGGERGFLPYPQQFCRAGRQNDFSRSGVSLGVPGHQPAALFPVEGAADAERPRFVVKIRPHETADFTQSETGGQFSVEKIMPDGVSFDGVHEGVQLFLVQDVHGLAGDFRWRHLIGGISGDEPLLHRRPERLVERGMDVVDSDA